MLDGLKIAFCFLSLIVFAGCCFVTFYARKDALKAQDALHNIKTLMGVSNFCCIHQLTFLFVTREYLVAKLKIKKKQKSHSEK